MTSNLYDNHLQFKGAFRDYQKKILDQATTYLKDKKIHIVAPPGSGKTTLGIELIRRLGKRALIISPRLVIRNQWIQRIEEAFLLDHSITLSTSLVENSDITSITYQTLFSAMTRFKGEERDDQETDDVVEKNEVDYSQFDFIKNIKENPIEVICLDECHHLHKEWWKALEEFISTIGRDHVTIISLTATPPYDAQKSEWNRYIQMCGEVDEEISIPELVKEKNLCPHQDYVLFSYPTANERKVIRDHHQTKINIFHYLMNHQDLLSALKNHKKINDYDHYADEMLEDPMYLSSLLFYYHSHSVEYDKRWKKLMGIIQFPNMTLPFFEKLLQGFLYDDIDSYSCDPSYREQLIIFLKKNHMIYKCKVILTDNAVIQSLLVNSMSKLPNLVTICKTEYCHNKDTLRMLILTDYIKKEYITMLGTGQSFHDLGVIPIFETLRKEMDPACLLGIVCGSLVVVPKGSLERLKELADGKSYTVSSFYDQYDQVVMAASNSDMVAILSKLFEEGYFQIMIGTKSLLGEGYDSPCINSLIMASFVGSYVLGNQMRGRAIRTYDQDPTKVANIWHLVCIDKAEEIDKMRILGFTEQAVNEDYMNLKRKFEGFLGVSYDGMTIENGLGRLTAIKEPFTLDNIKRINEEMLALSASREGLKEKWDHALYQHHETVLMFKEDNDVIKSKTSFDDVLGMILFNIVFWVVGISIDRFFRSLFSSRASNMFWMALIGIGISLFCYLIFRIYLHLSPGKYLKQVGKSIRDALVDKGEILETSRVMVEGNQFYHSIYLMNASLREKEIFVQCVDEFLGVVNNQRYLIRLKGRMFRFYVVPTYFEKKKEDAMLFLNQVKRHLGSCDLIYTRNIKGRRVLLKARMRSYANFVKGLEQSDRKEDHHLQKYK